YSRKISTHLSLPLEKLPRGEALHGEPPNLAMRDLLRGRALQLPSGQHAARECFAAHGVYVGMLTAKELDSVQNKRVRKILKSHEFDRRTPLWLYVLAEAELEQGGD